MADQSLGLVDTSPEVPGGHQNDEYLSWRWPVAGLAQGQFLEERKNVTAASSNIDDAKIHRSHSRRRRGKPGLRRARQPRPARHWTHPRKMEDRSIRSGLNGSDVWCP